jgi:hypothetical protein
MPEAATSITQQKMAPVQGYPGGIPWAIHLEAYEVYCKRWGPQPALIDLEGRNCRGGFSTGELDDFIPGWRDRVSEFGRMRAEVTRLTAHSVMLNKIVWRMSESLGLFDHGQQAANLDVDQVVDQFFGRLVAVAAHRASCPVQQVFDEVDRATQKFPTWPDHALHAVSILGEEFGELTRACLQMVYEPHKVTDEDVRTEAIQTAAMAIRFVMSLGRYRFDRSDQHSQQPAAAKEAK